MSRLVGLYPQLWRDRYEDEFLALMSDRPSTARDRLDVVRGAIDARLHPQRGPARPGESVSQRPARLAAGLAMLGGVLWVATALAFHGAAVIIDLGYKDSGSANLLGVAAGAATGLGCLLAASARPRQSVALRASAVAILLGSLALALPWPLVLLGFYGTLIATVAFGLIAMPRFGLMGIPLAAGATLAMGFNTEDDRALLLIPLGLAWLLVGLALADRGLPATAEASPKVR